MITKNSDHQNHPTNNYPEAIKEEFAQSLIDSEILALNFGYLEGEQAINAFFRECDNLPRTNTGRVSTTFLNKYDHLWHGYWFVNSFNPLKGKNNVGDMIQVKPVKPRSYCHKGKLKIIKYEAPKGGGTPYGFLNIPFKIIKQVAKKYNISDLPENHPYEKWVWIKNNPIIPITIAEGAKKASCLLSQGIIAVSCMSITTHSEKAIEGDAWFTELKPEIQWLLSEQGRKVYIAFDRGDNSQKAVNKQTKCLAYKLQKRLNQNVFILDWEKEQGKGIDDFTFNNGVAELHKLFDRALPYNRFVARMRALNTRKLSNSIKINERFFPQDLIQDAINSNIPLIGVKSQQFTGKTEATAQVIFEIAKQNKDLRILVLTHRRSLSRNLAKRFKIPCYLDPEHKGFYQCQGITICLDSLLRLDPMVTYDLIIIDECEQVLWHLLSANTEIKNKRGNVIDGLVNHFRNTIATNGSIIALDADLSDISVNTIKGLANLDRQVKLFENTFKPFVGRKLYSYSKVEGIRDSIKQSVANNERFVIATSGQKVCSTNGTINLFQWLVSLGVDPKLIAVIDQETITDPLHHCFGILDKLERLKDYQIIIYSPTVSTGVSLDTDLVGKFHKVYGIYYGNYPVDDFEQQLERLRDNCDRHVFCAKNTNNRIEGGDTSYNKLRDRFSFKAKYTASFHLDDIDYEQNLIDYFIAFTSRINGDYQNLRSNFLEHEREKGYTIEQVACIGSFSEIKQEAKAIKDKSSRDHGTNLYCATDIEKERYEELKQKKAKTKQERLEQEKEDIKRLYGENVFDFFYKNPELYYQFIIAHLGQGAYKKLRRRFFAQQGYKITKHYEKSKAQSDIQYKKDNNIKSYFLDETKRFDNTATNFLLSLLNIDFQQIESDCNYVSDEEIEQFNNLRGKGAKSLDYLRARNNLIPKLFCNDDLTRWCDDLRKTIGGSETFFSYYFDIPSHSIERLLSNDDNAFLLLRLILERFGYDFELVGKFQIEGTQRRYYRLTSIVDDAVWQEIKTHWEQELIDYAQKVA